MKEKTSKMTLVAKVIGGVMFLALFALNLTVYVQKDSNSSRLTLQTLNAQAQEQEEEAPNPCDEGLTKGTTTDVVSPNQVSVCIGGKKNNCTEIKTTTACDENAEGCVFAGNCGKTGSTLQDCQPTTTDCEEA